MARKPIPMKKIRELVRLKLDCKASLSQIASACNISRTTASQYCSRIVAAKVSWPQAQDLSDEELGRLVSPCEAGLKACPRPLPEFAQVRLDLTRKGVTLKLLWHT